MLVIIYVYFIHARNLYALHCGLAAQMSTLSSAKATEREVLLLQYSTVVQMKPLRCGRKGRISENKCKATEKNHVFMKKTRIKA